MNKQDPFRDHYKSLEGATIVSYEGVQGFNGCPHDGFPTFTVRLANGEVAQLEISCDPECNGAGYIYIAEPEVDDANSEWCQTTPEDCK